MNPLSRIRSWWHQPVLDRLDAIERNTRREEVAVEPPPAVLAADIGRAVREIRSARDGRKAWA